MKKFLMIGLLLLPLSVVSQGEINRLKLSAFVGEGMGSGFGISTAQSRPIAFSLCAGVGEFVYNKLRLSNNDDFFQNRVSYPDSSSISSYYKYEYSNILHFTFSSDFTIFQNKIFNLQFSTGMQFRFYIGTKITYHFVTQGNIGLCPDPEYINKDFHSLNFGFISTSKVSFFNNKKLSPFLSYGGFVDIVDATEFKWLHAFQIGVSYNWHRRVTE